MSKFFDLGSDTDDRNDVEEASRMTTDDLSKVSYWQSLHCDHLNHLVMLSKNCSYVQHVQRKPVKIFGNKWQP
jgi:hypothetical protein